MVDKSMQERGLISADDLAARELFYRRMAVDGLFKACPQRCPERLPADEFVSTTLQCSQSGRDRRSALPLSRVCSASDLQLLGRFSRTLAGWLSAFALGVCAGLLLTGRWFQ